jgi:alpha-aminoadipate carrier protein LysW
MVECPDCAADITVDKGTFKGEIVECPECGILLEVISVKPLKVMEAQQDDVDWDDED